MASEERDRKANFWQRLSPFEKMVGAGIGASALAALLLIGDGLYMKAKASLSQVLLRRSFVADLGGEARTRPWPWADFVTEAEISVPRLGQSAIVLSGVSGETLAFGPAWLEGTPRPGDEGTAVIAAHRDSHFRWLKDVKPGDRIELVMRDGRQLAFRAGQGRIARWDRNGIDPDALGVNLALATCWPFEATTRGPMRYIVDLALIEEPDPSRTAAAGPDTSALPAAFVR